MADLISAVGQGLSAIGGPLVAGGLNLVGGLMQQGSNQESIQQQENFQTQMSDTAYQRSVADMTKAGLNPALMYGSGGPESAPAGGAIPAPNVMQGATSSAMDAVNTQKQLQVSDSTIANNMANAALTTAKIPVENLEGGVATTVQSLIGSIENWLQGRSKTGAGGPGPLSRPTPGSLWDDMGDDVSKVSQSLVSGAGGGNFTSGASVGSDAYMGR